MPQSDYSSIISTLNGCVAQFYSADQYDLATLGSILAKLDEIHDECHVNEEFKSNLGAFVAELEHAMLSESALHIIQNGPTMLSTLIAMIPGSSQGYTAELDLRVSELTESQLTFVQENIGAIQDKIDQFEDLVLSLEQEDSCDCWESITSVIHLSLIHI